jgi:exodeoxyribonuclease V beta subunit
VVSRPATIVEASAGTGKTYQLEQLALGLIADGRARIDELLVVTFTERATSELVARIRATIDGVLAAPPETGDDAARRRRHLLEARRSFDQAAIMTIHAFCQGLLMDEPLATGRLVGQAQVDSRTAFGELFREVLRHTLSTDASHRRYLDSFLVDNRDVGTLETLLYRAATARGQWASRYDQGDLGRLVDDLAAIELAPLERFWSPILGNASSVKALKRRLASLEPALALARDSRDWPALLGIVDEISGDTFCGYVEKIAGARGMAPELGRLGDGLTGLLAVSTLIEATVQQFLPSVKEALEQRKLAGGFYDFDDMITSVARALDGPAGQDLIAKLRRRFRFALIDEAQDTDAPQWRIFERIFLDSNGANPCVLIGDPKQAIYGFRGADVHNYVAARGDILAREGAFFPLECNFRSADEVLRGVNAILDQAVLTPFFTNPDIVYDHPVESDRGALGSGAGVTLFQLDLSERPTKPLRVVAIKRALRRAIAMEIGRLRAEQPGLRLSDVFVLTRSNAETGELAAELRQWGIPHAFYKQEGLWKTAEAEHVRTLLAAIDDPLDRAARMQAWLTPFFGLTLGELEAMGAPPAHHPLLARLFAWKRFGEARHYPALFARILDESGVTRRLRLNPAGERRLTLYRQIFDQLLADTAARRLSVNELIATLGRYAAGQFPPSADGGTRDTDIQRAELDANAVQLITMHKAKGLEAEHVFLYGTLTNVPIGSADVHAFYRGHDRVFCAGKPRLPDTLTRIKVNRNEEDQRLLYVAMTRARHHLYLPFFPATASDDTELFGSESDHGDYRAFDRITGPYRHVNDQLRRLAADGPRFRALFGTRSVPFPAPDLKSDHEVAAELTVELGAWTPTVPPPEPTPSTPSPATLRATRRGFIVTSYSRLKDAAGGYQPPVLDEDTSPVLAAPTEVTEPTEPPALELPGGAATGLFLHAVLEKAALGVLPAYAEWEKQPLVRHLLEIECRRWDRDPSSLPAAARVVYDALTTPIAFAGSPLLQGIASAPHVRREVDFLFSLSKQGQSLERARGGHDAGRIVQDRGFIRGVLDVLYEHDGKVYFADWKSDMLPAFSDDALRAHVDANYELQIQIYTVALFRLLGVQDAADCAQRFGGLAYVFLRGLGAGRAPGAGVHVRRPAYDVVRSWERALVARPAGGDWE